jgi:hypothetical protein
MEMCRGDYLIACKSCVRNCHLNGVETEDLVLWDLEPDIASFNDNKICYDYIFKE